MKEQCIAAGMNDYSTKPVTKEQLQKKLALWGEPDRLSSVMDENKDSKLTAAENYELTDIFDAKRLEAITSMQQPDMPNILHKVISMYLSGSKHLMGNITKGIEQNNAITIMEAAHSLKYSSLNLGANKLGEYFKQLEVFADTKQIAASSSLMNDLIPEYNFICTELQKELSRKSNA